MSRITSLITTKFDMPRGSRLKIGIIAPALLALVGVLAFASGAPWYKWKNQVDKTTLCAQTTPGDAWEQYQGPFMDSRCKKPGNPQ